MLLDGGKWVLGRGGVRTFSYQASKSDSLSLEGERILEDTQRIPAPEAMVRIMVVGLVCCWLCSGVGYKKRCGGCHQ